MQISTMQYRQMRAAIRDASSIALDELDAMHHALAYGDAADARAAALRLSLVADDLTALLENIVRLSTYTTPN